MAAGVLDENEGRWSDLLSTSRRSSLGNRQSMRAVGARTTRNEAALGLDRRPDARSVEESSTVGAGFMAGLRRARSWRVPPNWSAIDWREELRAVALAAAWQAEQDHDPSRGVPLAAFVCCRVKAQALTRSRQEWRYALRITPASTDILERASAPDPATISIGISSESLAETIQGLPEPERWLLDQLFWQHRTEVSIAVELHISQPAVSKRKRAALLLLRSTL